MLCLHLGRLRVCAPVRALQERAIEGPGAFDHSGSATVQESARQAR
jgi:hypothetical protein